LLQFRNTPVHFASANGHLDVVRYLIEERGADVNATDDVSEFDRLIFALTQHHILQWVHFHCSSDKSGKCVEMNVADW
jgi:hypothetical protein